MFKELINRLKPDNNKLITTEIIEWNIVLYYNITFCSQVAGLGSLHWGQPGHAVDAGMRGRPRRTGQAVDQQGCQHRTQGQERFGL